MEQKEQNSTVSEPKTETQNSEEYRSRQEKNAAAEAKKKKGRRKGTAGTVVKVIVWIVVIIFAIFLTLFLTSRIAGFDNIGELLKYISAQI